MPGSASASAAARRPTATGRTRSSRSRSEKLITRPGDDPRGGHGSPVPRHPRCIAGASRSPDSGSPQEGSSRASSRAEPGGVGWRRVPTPHRLPAEGPAQGLGSGSTWHARFQEWCSAGVFTEIFSELLRFYDRKRGIQWKWSSLDSALVKAPEGGASRVRIRRTAREVASNAAS